jgi:hypothetical protein
VIATMKRGSRWCLAAGAALCVGLTGCAAPVLGDAGYRHAALGTAMAMTSSLATAKLAVQNDLRGGNLLAFTDEAVTNAENDADSVDSTFSSRQPPGPGSAALSRKMSQALSEGTDALASLRIAVRQHSRPQMLSALTAVNKALRVFSGIQRELQ